MGLIFLDLINAVRQGAMSVGDFSSAVENEWNFGTERATLSEHERASVQKLFDVVVYYSPYPEERARIPNYRDENDVILAAQTCREAFQSNAIIAAYDSLLNDVCVRLGFCGSVVHDEPLHIEQFLPQTGGLSADDFADALFKAEGLDPEGSEARRFRPSVRDAFVRHMGGGLLR